MRLRYFLLGMLVGTAVTVAGFTLGSVVWTESPPGVRSGLSRTFGWGKAVGGQCDCASFYPD